MRAVLLAATIAMVACTEQPVLQPTDAFVADMSGPANACPNDLPMACPSPAPSWSGSVQAIEQLECAGCHQPTGDAPTFPLQTYDQVYAQRGAVLDQVYSCLMPPPDMGMLSDSERAALLGWLVCGAPNN